MVVQEIRNESPYLSTFGSVVEEIKTLSMFFVSCSFSSARRRGNQVAHELTSFARINKCNKVLIDRLPNFLGHYVLSDSIGYFFFVTLGTILIKEEIQQLEPHIYTKR
ncbi:RVT_3 domain-containing protein [Cephalotus follicularis]|uniref:RVT_3 domain-containing protein n=1 Tax=Cephalotus follicularis TaxID=3775 RepID=A0A1Q3AXX7_CEPFO|nr:RVT_3 domain-containing protein [Cephalotus follicularis]